MKRCCLFIIACLVLSGCKPVATGDIKVQAQANPKTNFDGYKTYGWSKTVMIVNDPYGQWEPPAFDADAEIRNLIEQQLRSRGMKEDPLLPDLIVGFSAGVNIDAYKIKVDPNTKMDILEQVPKGGLVVVFMDGETGMVNWVGMATAEVQKQPSTETVKKRLDYAVTEMFKKLPK